MDYYDINKLIEYASTPGVDISPTEREEWTLFCCALKVLGYDLNTLISMSNCTAADCEKAWKKEKNPGKYVPSEDKAKAKIVALAKAANIDLTPFKLSTGVNRGDRGKQGLTGVNRGNRGKQGLTGVNRGKQGLTGVTGVTGVNRGKEFGAPSAPKLPPIFLDLEEVETVEKDAEKSALFAFLCSLFPVDEVRRVFRLYRIGATKEFNTEAPALASAFPYINAGGQCVDIHLMPYEADGHRRKTDYNQNWLIAKKKQSDRRAPWPLFGEHLLPLDPSAPVGIVESEKTALIASICAPGYVWTATGSLSNLNPQRCAALACRQCYIFPDADGLSQWKGKAQILHSVGFSVYFCGDYITDHAQAPKDDLGDILCRYYSNLDDTDI